VASVPPFVTVPQFAGGGGFIVTTSTPAAPTTVTISASGGGVTKTATLTVNPFPTGPSISSLTLGPAGVTGGASSTGTVTLAAAAPAGGASVALSSTDTAVATVPAAVAVPAGATRATFTVTSKAVTAAGSATIAGTLGGVTRTAVLTVSPASTPPPAGDTVAIQVAEYVAGKGQLSVEATSSSPSATTRVFDASGTLIGTLANDGGGRYRGQFSWPSNPQSIVVRSNLGGSSTRAVTSK
jgi:hypothetical protein